MSNLLPLRGDLVVNLVGYELSALSHSLVETYVQMPVQEIFRLSPTCKP